MLNKTANSVHVTWTSLPAQVNNGKIFGYKVCRKLSSTRAPCFKVVYVDYRTTSYTLRELSPYTGYDIEVSAGTIAGYGAKAILSVVTEQSSEFKTTECTVIDTSALDWTGCILKYQRMQYNAFTFSRMTPHFKKYINVQRILHMYEHSTNNYKR